MFCVISNILIEFKAMETKIFDLAIIGGGPAGVAAGVYASRKRLSTVFITKDFESQSTVSEGIENWIGTVRISGADFAKSLKNHLLAYAGDIVTVKEGELCQNIERVINKEGHDGYAFKVTTKSSNPNNKDSSEYIAKTVLITTGSSRKKLPVKGADIFEHKGLTYCATCDGPLFSGQEVAVIGGGNAAFESASQLLAYCSKVTLINRSGELRADPITVKKVLSNPHMVSIINAVPKEVLGEKFVTGFVYTDVSDPKKPVDKTIPVTGIFVEIGSLPATSFAEKIVERNPVGNILVDPRNQRAKTIGGFSGIWAAGDCTDGLYHQNNIAAGDAVKALEDIYLYLRA